MQIKSTPKLTHAFGLEVLTFVRNKPAIVMPAKAGIQERTR
ncbi:hypothetical protein ACFL17_05920 [Pseudomonadota bacterium]